MRELKPTWVKHLLSATVRKQWGIDLNLGSPVNHYIIPLFDKYTRQKVESTPWVMKPTAVKVLTSGRGREW